MSKILRICACVFALVFVADNAWAACAASTKRYTSCKSGYYLNGTGAGNSCTSCTTVSATDLSQSCSRSPTSTELNNANAYAGSIIGAKKRCAGKHTGGAGGTSGSGSCTGCNAWEPCAGGSLTISSCKSGYYKSGNSCPACTGVSATDLSQSCSRNPTSTELSNAHAYAGTISGAKQQCTGKHTGGAGGTSGSGSCTGCSSWGSCSGGTLTITSCAAGYYKDGNSCKSCPSGYTSANGTTGGIGSCYKSCSSYSVTNGTNIPNSTTVYYPTNCSYYTSCNGGYYLSGGSCVDCGSGYYCVAGSNKRVSCSTTVKSGSPTPNAIRSLSNGSWSDYNHAVKSSDCYCDWYLSDSTRTQYLNQVPCQDGPSGYDYTKYSWCRTGYYADNPLTFNEWYTSCSPCTNGPANSTYTSYSTPSAMYAVESNCPWQCNAGYYKSGSSCPACTGVSATDLSQSCSRSPTSTELSNAHAYAGSISGAKQQCTGKHTGGPGGTSGSGSCTGCNAWGPCSGGSLTISSCKSGYYKSGNSCPKCPSGYTSAAGTTGGIGSCYKSCTKSCTQSCTISNASSCTYGSKTTSGTQYYGGSCDASNPGNCPITGWSCNAKYYHTDSGCSACTGVSATDLSQSCSRNPTSTELSNAHAYAGTISGAKQQCTGKHTGGPAGATSSSQCTGCSSWGSCSGGSLTITSCAAGYYKDGNSCKSCPSGYPNSPDGNTGGITSCYSNTKSRAWTGGQTACAKPSGCASVSCKACSGSACNYVAYSNSAGTGDGTIKSGCSTNNANCQQELDKPTSASADHYISGSTCPACPDAYPNSAGGNIGQSGCYAICSTQSITGGNRVPVSSTVYYGNNCEYTTVCNDGYNQSSDGVCSQLCVPGFTTLRTGSGLVIPLYSEKLSSPAIHIGYNGGMCYGILESGSGDGINLEYNGQTYHTGR